MAAVARRSARRLSAAHGLGTRLARRAFVTFSSREQADAVRGLARQHSYNDAARVGVWGWSGGGSATLNAMFRYPDVYHVGMAVAPV